jgi:hypothetical protein
MTFKTKPQYLLPVPKANSGNSPLPFQRIYKIDYDITIKHWEMYPLTASGIGGASITENRAIKPVIIITISGGCETSSYRWYRPNIDAIIAEENFDLLNRFLSQDVLRHL